MLRPSSYFRLFLPVAAFLFILLGVVQPAHAQLGSATPNVGTTAGGTVVDITSIASLTGTLVSVQFGGVPATNIQLVDLFTVRATAPAHAAGVVNVTVTLQVIVPITLTLANGYTYVAPPTVTSVVPNVGPTTGNTSVTIGGTNFRTGMSVTFGGQAATNVVLGSATSLTATTPAHAAGAVNVVVTNIENESATLSSGFTYQPVISTPTISQIAPNSGSAIGGTPATINGSGFLSGASVTIGGASATSIIVQSAGTITAVTPAGVAGARDVVVTNPDTGTATLTNGFTYVAISSPTLTAVTPSSGATLGGTAVQLSGTGFEPGATVTFDGLAAGNVIVGTTETITATTPAHAAGSVNVVVTNPDTGTATLPGGYTYVLVSGPTLGSASPSMGTTAGGTVVDITSLTALTGTLGTVEFDGIPATNVQLIDLFTIRATSPAHIAGVVDITVNLTILLVPVTVTLEDSYTYVPPPTVSSAVPNVGPVVGGTAVTIGGNNFRTGMSVTFDGQPATGVIVNTSASLTATTPAHAVGPVDIVVTNIENESTTLVDGFTYEATISSPSISGITPTSGTTDGGTAVTISGDGFAAGATVTIGGAPATSVVVQSATSITALTPAGTPGPRDVVVTNADTGTATLTGGYTYVLITPPTLGTLTPSEGTTAGGTVVTITSVTALTGLLVGVEFDGVPATNVQLIDLFTIQATTPTHAPGVVDVAVRLQILLVPITVNIANGYTYIAPPTITSVVPNVGPAGGGTVVTIGGTNFRTGMTVTFDGQPATDISVGSNTTLTATTPAHALGPVDVVVTNIENESATLTSGFTYQLVISTPTISGIVPTSGSAVGGTPVTISGSGFVSGATVTIGGVLATSVIVQGAGTITAVTPSGIAGAQDVIVTNPDTGAATLIGGFTYVAISSPTLTAVSPSSGATVGGTAVQLSGTGFEPGATVTFDGVSASNVIVATTDTITAVTPSHAAGTVDVVVTNPDTGTATLAGGYTYVLVTPPTLGSASPSMGTTAGGTIVDITSLTALTGTLGSVEFDGIPATNVQLLNLFTIRVTSPAHAAGVVDITVRMTILFLPVTITLDDSYTYVPPPTVSSATPNVGPIAGGTAVTIGGNNFRAGMSVTFGGQAATGVTVNSSASLTATTPAHPVGPVDIVVTNIENESTTLVDGFTYEPTTSTPSISAITPTSGTSDGGTPVAITGDGFAPGATVTIGGAAATSVVIQSGTSITAVTPAGTPGPRDVVVTNTDTGTATLTGGYTYVLITPPTLGTITPPEGTTAGGTVVTITSVSALTGALAGVEFDGVPATNVQLIDLFTIQATTPAHAPGVVDVAVRLQILFIPITVNIANGYTYIAPPTVTSVVPSFGPVSGGTLVTVGGTNFRSSMNVTLDGLPATGISVASNTSLTATTPAHAAGPVNVVVTNVENESATLSAGFTYQPLISSPSISGIVPTTGPTSGGTPVVISGSGFVAGASVTIGGGLAASIVVQSSTSITAVTPVGTAGARDVVVTNPDTGTVTLVAGFTYIATSSPTLTNVSPNLGPVTGGTPTTLTGTGFQAGATVLFGATAATNVIVASATTITVTTPAGSAGPVTVAVTNPDSGSATLPDAFTYQAISSPTVTAVSPSSGLTIGGTSVVITGTDFQPGAVVTFDGLALTNVIVATSTTITGVTPAHIVGPVDVVVTNLDSGVTTLPSGFSYVISAPTITSVTPPTGSTSGGTAVTIAGTGFQPGATVVICGSPATNVVVVDATTITAVTPTCAGGNADVTVTNPDGGSATLAGGFGTGVTDPIVGTVTPNSGLVTGGTPVTILGGNFVSGLTVTFGGLLATSVVVLTDSTITAVTPPHAAGMVNVVVTNPDTSSDALAGGFTYNPLSTPTLTGMSPNSGPAAGGTAVVITGTGFLPGATLTIEGVSLTNLVVASSTTMTGVTGACASPGLQDITVLNPDGGTATLGNAFTCTVVSSPSISSVSPNSGPTAGGTQITINGLAFAAGATVLVGDLPATNVEVLSATAIRSVTAPHASGPVSVQVLNADGGAIMLAGGYTYLGAAPSPNDNDNDGLGDDCEIEYGLDTSSGTGDDGPNGDPDGDGSTNAEECANGTHPRGFFTRYFAEGATGDFFDMRLSLVNATSEQAIVLVRYMSITGAQASDYLLVPGQSYKAVNPESNATTASAEFSTVIESDVEIVAERSMFWDATHYGSHAETSLPAPGLTWYLAEGATHSGFDLFYLLQNPNPSAAEIEVSFLRPAGRPPIVKHYTVAAETRLNIWVDLADPELAEEEISAVIRSTNNVPILVERAMYLHAQGRHFGAGHGSQGVREPATTWSFAEGATGDFFDTFVLVANPNTTNAHVRATYLLTTGQEILKDYVVLPNSRATIWVDVEDPQLANTAVSVRLESVDGLPIIAERAMWWPGPTSATWYEAHNSAGAQLTGVEWVVAQGQVGGSDHAETYVLIANQSSFDGSAEVTVLVEGGTVQRRTVSLPARSRTNVDVGTDFPSVDGTRFGVIVASQGPTPAQVIVESSVYLSRVGEVWAAGSNALATRLR